MGLVLKGIGIGLSIILPGMSAGTAALVLGIYDWVINGIRRLAIIELSPVLVGALLGVMAGARVLTRFLHTSPGLVMSFLLGLVLASAVWVLRRTGKVTVPKVVVGIAALVSAWTLAPEPVYSALSQDTSFIFIFISGVVSSAAMILPGISGSSIMIMLGQYQRMLAAIVDWNWTLLAIFSAGALVGILAFAQVIAALLRRFPNLTLVALCGLMLGAGRSLIPPRFGLPELAALAVGALLVGLFRERE